MHRLLPFALAAACIAAFQIAATFIGGEYILNQLIMSAWYCLVVIGLCLLMGYAGQISLGHAAFFAIGGYTTAVLSTMNLLPAGKTVIVTSLSAAGLTAPGIDLWGSPVLRLSPWVSLVAAVIASAAIAYAIGIPVLRLKGHYLAMATLGFGTIIYRIALGTPLLGAADGLSDVPPFPLFAGLAIDGSKAHRLFGYYFSWFMVLAVTALFGNLINSRAGRALRAIHGNESAAQAMGVDTSRYKLHLFALSAMVAAVAGVFMTHYTGGIGPGEAGVMRSVRYVAIVAVGGMANLWGAIVAGTVLNFLSLRGYFGTYDDAVFGAVLIGMMLFSPMGSSGKNGRRKCFAGATNGSPLRRCDSNRHRLSDGSAMSLLEVTKLCKSFGGLHAVRDVSFSVAAGTIKGVIGPNGAGKTTLFNCIAGSLHPNSGRYTLMTGRSTGCLRTPWPAAESPGPSRPSSCLPI